MENLALAHLQVIYSIIIVIFVFLPFLVYYFKSKSFQMPMKLIHYTLIFIFSSISGIVFLLIEFVSRPDSGVFLLKTPSEFLIINIIVLLFFFLFQSYIWSLVYGHEIFIPSSIKRENLISLLKKTNTRLGAKPYRIPPATGAEFYVSGSFYTRFDQFIQETETPKGFKVFLTHSTRNLRILYLFQTILILPLMLVRSNSIPSSTETDFNKILLFKLNLSNSQNPFQIDIIVWFSFVLILFLFFTISLSSISENLLLSFEDVYKKEKVEKAISLPSFNIKKPNTDIGTLKDGLKKKKDSALSKLESEKKRRVEDVMGILNPSKKEEEEEEVKQLDPNVLRLEALIFTVRTVLQATPSHRKITLDELVDYFSKKVKTNAEEVESIVFGLIQRKEVEGSYNIWDKIYSGGTPARRFVDKTLEFADETMQGELSTVKVKSDGSVEFYFNVNPDTVKDGTEDSSEREGENEEKNADKFDSI